MRLQLVAAASVALGLTLSACEAKSAVETAAAAPVATQSADAANLDPAILAASRTTPEAFVRSLLANYNQEVALEAMPDNRAFFSAATSDLIAENDRLAGGEVGYFDADPICQCQDWMNIVVTDAETTTTDATHASVRATSRDGDSTLVQTYILIKEAGGWRVDDIVHPEFGSMVDGVKASNTELASL